MSSALQEHFAIAIQRDENMSDASAPPKAEAIYQKIEKAFSSSKNDQGPQGGKGSKSKPSDQNPKGKGQGSGAPYPSKKKKKNQKPKKPKVFTSKGQGKKGPRKRRVPKKGKGKGTVKGKGKGRSNPIGSSQRSWWQAKNQRDKGKGKRTGKGNKGNDQKLHWGEQRNAKGAWRTGKGKGS